MLSPHIRIGPRTIKTAAAVIISMVIVHFYGTTTSRLTFAMLGAMAAVEPTFTDSLRSCLAQIVGVVFGSLVGVLLLAIPMHPLLRTGIGIVLAITLYNTFRIWDTAIGLAVGLTINTLVFPYDNSRLILASIESLDRELIRFLEEMFDGDLVLPDPVRMEQQVGDMARQLAIFSNQWLYLRRRSQKQQLEAFRRCQSKARELLARMEILSHMEQPGPRYRHQLSCGPDLEAPPGAFGGAAPMRGKEGLR